LTQSRFVSSLITIPGSVAANNRPFISRYGFYYIVRRCIAPKHILKLPAISLQRIQLGYDLISFRTHVGSGPGRHRLLFKRGTAAIPVELFVITNIPKRWAATRQLLIESADCFRQT